jgi:hypothetical protein
MIQRLVPNARVELVMGRWKEETGRIDVGFHERRIWFWWLLPLSKAD